MLSRLRRNDIILIASILLFALGFLIVGKLINQTSGLTAQIYVNGLRVETIDLHAIPDDPGHYEIFEITGALGPVIVVARHDAIKIEEVNCRHEICAAHGFVSSTIRPIVCLPNGIVIRLVGGLNTIPDMDIQT